MPRKISAKLCVILLSAVVCAALAQAQAPAAPVARPNPRVAPATAATIDTSEAMFATMCAL
jgi:hypothetical protein